MPDWFTDALADVARVDTLPVVGAEISYRTWGISSPSGPDLLLVHGGAANAHWWDHLAPTLADRRRVVAVDLSGHGDSDHRAAYSLDGWADELAAVITAAELGGPPVVIGHSMGGLATTVLARRGTPALTGVIIVDSPIEPAGTPRPESDPASFGHARVYATKEEAVTRFRPVPAQSSIDYIARHIAEHSVREVAGGWGWKFDPAFLNLAGDPPRTLDGLACPVVMILGEHGLLSPAARVTFAASDEVVVIEIPDAGHAMMLDEPVALLDAIQSTLDRWHA
ncbi:alpha/beta fold hydrolase [Subtercola boreus]|uniref:alpha/beta fold hydrolase n=1 Tax=Subtercola boreus TaxID=120213 RepID=UPI001C0F30C6|nr:alpha/beta hydrolase [Subtercola boreus]